MMQNERERKMFAYGLFAGIAITLVAEILYGYNHLVQNEGALDRIVLDVNGQQFYDVNNTALLGVISERENSTAHWPYKIYAGVIDGNVVMEIPFYSKGNEFLGNIMLNKTEIGLAQNKTGGN